MDQRDWNIALCIIGAFVGIMMLTVIAMWTPWKLTPEDPCSACRQQQVARDGGAR